MPAIPFAVAAVSKLALYTLCTSVQVEGLEHLVAALASGKGVLTVSNHISVIDDPLAVSAALPLRYFLSKDTTRWTLGASDICFTTPFRRAFFTNGQVIETYRSAHAPEKAGIYQLAIDEATRKLDRGQWLHIFPEAKTHQSSTREVLRFRWGVSRVLMECKNDYEVIPIWLQGFDDLMPDTRTFPRFIPRFFGTRIRIVIGAPCTRRVRPLIDAYRAKAGGPVPLTDPEVPLVLDGQGYGSNRPRPPLYEGDSIAAKEARIAIASALRDEVLALGQRAPPLEPLKTMDTRIS